MEERSARSLIYFFGLIVLFLLGWGVLLLFNLSYDQFVYSLLAQCGKLHKMAEFKRDYLPAEKFRLIQYVASFFLGVYLVSLVALWKKTDAALNFLQTFLRACQNSFRHILEAFASLNEGERYAFASIFLFMFIWRVYNLFALPITYDEAYTYLNFSSKNVLVSASHYRTVNNHVLFSIITNFFALLPMDPTLAIRLPNLLIGLFAALLVFLFLKEYFNAPIALIGFTLFSFSYEVSLYSIHARGYILLTVCFILSSYSLIKIALNGERKFYWLVFSVASILGFYTIPTFLYSFLTLFIFGFSCFLYQRDTAKLKHLALSFCLIGFFVLLLYAPVLIITGFNQVVHNEHFRSKSLTVLAPKFLFHLNNSLSILFGLKNYGGKITLFLMAGILLSLLYRTNRRIRFLSFFSLLSLLLPIVFLVCQRVLPPQRAWIYLSWPLIVGMGVIFSNILELFSAALKNTPQKEKILNRFVFGICMMLAAGGVINFPPFYKSKYQMHLDADRFTNFLTQQPVHTIYTDYDRYDVFLTYHSLLRHKDYKIDRNMPFDPQKMYDCLVVDKFTSTPKLYEQSGYRLFYEDAQILAFRKI